MKTNNQIPYTYCFIRKDLPVAQQIIQASHATQEITKKIQHPDQTCHFILLEAKNKTHLFDIMLKLKERGIEHEMFYEPDVQENTAIATEPIYGISSKLIPFDSHLIMISLVSFASSSLSA